MQYPVKMIVFKHFDKFNDKLYKKLLNMPFKVISIFITSPNSVFMEIIQNTAYIR